MKDSLDKQDKSKTVDIFQVMADAIQKEIFHSKFQSLKMLNTSNIRSSKLHSIFLTEFCSQSKNNQINLGPSAAVDASKECQYSPATLAAAKKFKRFLGK